MLQLLLGNGIFFSVEKLCSLILNFRVLNQEEKERGEEKEEEEGNETQKVITLKK